MELVALIAFGAVEQDGRRFAAARFGDDVADLTALDAGLFRGGTLDRFLAAGPTAWEQVIADASGLDRRPLAGADPVLAFTVADYVDFYASEDHATNAGRIFRPDGDALPKAWKHLPIGYHGRSASIVVDGTPVRRPKGLRGPGDFGPCRRLDFEAEVGFVVGVGGTEIAVEDAAEHVFGVCLLNDWSARDIQAFETVPLGPFLGKSFATSVAAWITPLGVLPATAHSQDPEPAAHLIDHGRHRLDLELSVSLNGEVVSRPQFARLHWTYAQMLAHLTSNGARVRTGDLFASGTVSGPERGHRGCLLELTWNGAEPLELSGGQTRAWLEDGDLVTIAARAGDADLAPVSATVEPAGP